MTRVNLGFIHKGALTLTRRASSSLSEAAAVSIADVPMLPVLRPHKTNCTTPKMIIPYKRLTSLTYTSENCGYVIGISNVVKCLLHFWRSYLRNRIERINVRKRVG
jgi:hypothetical protein